MTVLVHALLYLLLASLVITNLMLAGPRRLGPEGAVGVWLVFVPSLVLAFLFLVTGSLSGHFAWMLPNRFAWLLLSAGILVSLGVALFALIDRGMSRRLGIAVTMVVGAACFLALDPEIGLTGAARRVLPMLLFGLLALAGHALLIKTMFRHTIGRRAWLEAQYRAADEAEQRRAQGDVDEFAAVPVDAPFLTVSRFLWSSTGPVRTQARERLQARPDLEAQMVECLGIDGADEAVACYIAYVQSQPLPTMAPAYAAFLDRQFTSWQHSRLIGADPALWEPNLAAWFDAAERIQAAGGELRPSLTRWREAFELIPGFEQQAQRIGRIR